MRERDRLILKQHKEEIERIEAAEREKADREQHAQYVREMSSQGLTPLPFDQWNKFLPEEDQHDASVRAAIATARSNWHSLVQMTASQVESKPLKDDELAELGFDLEERPQTGAELNLWSIRAALESFMRQEPRYDKASHFDKLSDFLIRNSLDATSKNFALAFNLLWNFRLIEPKPEPEPEQRTPQVNLEIEPDPEIERRKARERYFTGIVITDPRTGQGLTQYQVDRLSAEDYRRLYFGEFGVPKITDVLTTHR